METIGAVRAGQKRVPPEVADHATDDSLTSRKTNVLRLFAVGNASNEVAALLSITEEPVKGKILAKLGATDRTHTVTIGFKRGIIEL